MTKTPQTVFFDIGGTLGSLSISFPDASLKSFVAYPFIEGVLEELRNSGARLGIISDMSDATSESLQALLYKAKIYQFFDHDLIICSSSAGLDKISPAIFPLAAQRAEHAASPEKCLFVGEDSRKRQHALQAGFKVCPHPLLAKEVLNGGRLRYACLSVSAEQHEIQWRKVLRVLSVVPLQSSGDRGTTILGIVSQSTVPKLVNSQFEVQLLGELDDPLSTDLYLLRDDLAAGTGFLSEKGQSSRLFEKTEDSRLLLSSSAEGLLVKVPSGRSVEEFRLEKSYHGHYLKLTPDLFLLEPFGSVFSEHAAKWLATKAVTSALSDSEKDELSKITAQSLQQYLDRYTGEKPLGDGTGTPIKSRHVESTDNARATEMLANDLQRIGASDFSVSLHPFNHNGRTLYNVSAELSGESADELVLITAHLDSTAAFSQPYDASQDPAPGADDDGSGIAAVLAIAATMRKLAAAKKPKRSLRFILFNAEEHGLVGSRAYARDAAAQNARIVAVFQTDMIGYNVLAPRSFEIHAGYLPLQEVQARSLGLALRLRHLAKMVSPLLAGPQIYMSNGQDQRDPAEGRSDHFPFQQHGYAACVTTEDFFVGPATDSPVPEPNPNYHKKTDTFVDLAYAADIARCVAAAAWVTANPIAVDPTPWLSLLLTDERGELSPGVTGLLIND